LPVILGSRVRQIYNSGNPTAGEWPTTKPADWCGEFQAKSAPCDPYCKRSDNLTDLQHAQIDEHEAVLAEREACALVSYYIASQAQNKTVIFPSPESVAFQIASMIRERT